MISESQAVRQDLPADLRIPGKKRVGFGLSLEQFRLAGDVGILAEPANLQMRCDFLRFAASVCKSEEFRGANWTPAQRRRSSHGYIPTPCNGQDLDRFLFWPMIQRLEQRRL
jgi:hypothetical protein